VDYVRDVKPVLAAHCYACHGALQQKAGLRVDTAALLRKGGDAGAAVVPARADDSPLMDHLLGRKGARRMPPRDVATPLSRAEIARIRAWIDQGTAAPADERPEPDPRAHWAFRPPVRPPVPRSAGARNPIDAFIAAERDRRRLVPQPPADRRLLLRRVYLDLIGLPPGRRELDAFLADPSPDAYEKVVERLLASPQYGERWGRHWMDVWRYSDPWGLGAEIRNSQPHVWHWRDWIIESLNADKGYDQMLREMLAADELYPNDLDRLRATGFLVRSYFKFNRNSWLDDTVEHTSKAFLGLTLNCARCHDHKFDPISQRDYYRFRAFFEPYQVRTDELPGQVDLDKDGLPRVFDCNLDAPTYLFVRGDERRPARNQPLRPGVPALLANGDLAIRPVTLPAEAHAPGLRPYVLADHLRAAQGRVAAAHEKLHQARAARRHTAAAVRVAETVVAVAEAEADALRARAEADRARAREPARRAARAECRLAVARAEEAVARAEWERLTVRNKAEADKKLAAARQALAAASKLAEAPGERYTPLRGSIKTLESNVETEASRNRPYPATSTGRRSALARWLTDPRNPLTARVAVNHVWARHFGQPLVPTVFDFGRRGTPPTHPELLDWLAVEFVEHGWSMKHLHRLLVTSDTYRLSSSAAGAADIDRRADAANRYYWRMNPVRMEAEVIRDSLLELAGELDPARGGPPTDLAAEDASRRRSLYFVHSHNDNHRFLETFDQANVLECYRRAESIVPQQALALSNSGLTRHAAERIAARLREQLGPLPDARFIRAAFETVLASAPTPAEQDVCERALAELTAALKKHGEPDAVRRARVDLVHALLNHNDFITVR
jgi:hypothetical protein